MRLRRYDNLFCKYKQRNVVNDAQKSIVRKKNILLCVKQNVSVITIALPSMN